MKTQSLFYILSSIMFCFILTFSSCCKDPCEDKVCLNGGTCTDGACECPVGFTGTDCGQFIGGGNVSTPQYDCVSGNCMQANGAGQYPNLSACQGSCGNSSDYSSLSIEVQNIVSESAYNLIVGDLGMPIFTGNDPTCLEGSFEADPLFIEVTTVSTDPGNGIGPGTQIAPVSWNFCAQNMSTNEIRVNWTDPFATGNGDGSWITGSGNQFTIWTELWLYNSGVNYQSIKIVTGNMTPEGIENCYITTFMLDNDGNPNGNLLGNNEGRVVYDDDGRADRMSAQACFGC